MEKKMETTIEFWSLGFRVKGFEAGVGPYNQLKNINI